MGSKITVVDYGVGNLFSVCRALEHCGAEVELTSDPAVASRADKILLPGVGAFGDGMRLLNEHGMDQALKEAAARGAHLLGVCLGMQLLLDTSDEFGLGHGLGLIPGKVVAIPRETISGSLQKIPHIGWNDLVLPADRDRWDGSLLQSLRPHSPMYFIHSYMAEPLDPKHRLANCIYGGAPVAAVIGNDNVWGTQFHPEKSGEAGLSVLKQFIAQK